MYLPDTPSKAAENLSDSAILGLFKAWGRCGKVAIRRALAMLPEIIRRGLYRKHFASPFEFAIKTLGVTRDVVERVLRLHEQIGHMPELWSLLSTGEEGWSKLEIVAGVATPDTAAWWAEQVRKCSAAELRELLRRYKAQDAARQDVARPDASQQDTARQDAARQSAIGDLAGGNAVLPFGYSAPSEAAPAEPAGGATSTSSSASDRQPSDVNGSRVVNGSLQEAPSPGDPSPKAPPIVSESAGKPRPVTIYLTSEDEDLLRAWQASLRRAEGETLSLGEVIGRLLRGELLHQRPPGALAPELQGASGGDQSASDGERSADLAPKRVEVLIRPVGVPGDWARKLMGVLPTGIAAAFRPHETIVLEDLFLDAVEAARRHTGDRIPFAVRKFVALRAGFRCETGGCQSPLHDLDHDKPRAEGGDHHPDSVHARCVRHHKMRHKALFTDIAAGIVVGPGSSDLSSPADRAFQSAQARAVASGP